MSANEPPDPTHGIDLRKQEVLRAVVTDYTVTATPVGSQQLAERYFARWSSATIRNELAHLMDSGHLRQPHTSSGRVPSDLGYRFFVDHLMETEVVDPGARQRMQQIFSDLPPDLEAILEGTAMAVAREAENVGVVTAPRTRSSKLKYNDLIHLEGRRILALVVLEGNVVRQQPLQLSLEVGQEELSEFSSRLNQATRGLNQDQFRAAVATTQMAPWQREAALGIADVMESFDAQSAQVIVHDGVRNLVRQPEFLDGEKLLPVLELLEESRSLARVLESIEVGEEVEVLIGDENPDSHLRECSVVMTTYSADRVRGTLGTIGPTRMRYAQVAARMRFISLLAGEAISRLYT